MSSVVKMRADQWLSLACVTLAVAICSRAPIKSNSPVVVAPMQATPELELIKLQPVPVLMATVSQSAETLQATLRSRLSAQAVMVQDVETGAVLFEKASREQRPPASTTKLLTALVTRSIYPLDQVVTIQEEAFSQGTVIQLQVGEQLTVNSLLYGLLMSSGNDAAFALANHHRLGYAGFVATMNQMAKRWHLDDTHFTNPSGLDQPEHVTSARDLALMTKLAFQDPVLKTMMGTKFTIISDITGHWQHRLQSTHQLLGQNSVVLAGKTGTTELAGEVLVNVAQIKNHQVIVVVMGSQDRYADTLQIFDWLNQHYQWLEQE